MKVQVNTDRNVEGSEALARSVEAEVQSALERFQDRLTRVEVHLGDDDGPKSGSGADKRCLLEARPTGMQPVVVSEVADTLDRAFRDAMRKMQSLLTSKFDRVDRH